VLKLYREYVSLRSPGQLAPHVLFHVRFFCYFMNLFVVLINWLIDWYWLIERGSKYSMRMRLMIEMRSWDDDDDDVMWWWCYPPSSTIHVVSQLRFAQIKGRTRHTNSSLLTHRCHCCYYYHCYYRRRRRRLCFYFGLFCLFVCPSDNWKSCERILTKFLGGVGHGPGTMWLNFGYDLDHRSDLWVRSPKSGFTGLSKKYLVDSDQSCI